MSTAMSTFIGLLCALVAFLGCYVALLHIRVDILTKSMGRMSKATHDSITELMKAISSNGESLLILNSKINEVHEINKLRR